MSTHHARLIFSSSEQARSQFIAGCGLDSEVALYQYETVTIGDVRLLISTAYLKPAQFDSRTIFIAAQAIAPEAQQALLKILEEPPLSTRFVLWLRPGAVLLPTLRSRLSLETVIDSLIKGVVVTNNSVFLEFLQSAYAARLDQIATITKNKNVSVLAELASGLGTYVEEMTILPVALRSQLAWCLSQLELRGASKKMLWEEISLLLPVESKL